jgi:ABC-type transport system involved in cytochrome bd biosynthesis fused ATPase/permease subunit
MKLAQLRLLLSWSSSRSLFLLIAVGAAISTTVVISLALLISQVVVNLVQGNDDVLQNIIQIGAVWAIRALFQSQFDYWTSLQAIKIKSELRNGVTSELPRLTATSPAVITNLLVKGFNSLDIYIGRYLPQMISAMLTPISVIVTIAIFDRTSAVIAILTLPLIPLFGALIGKYTADSVSKKWETLGTLSKYFEDSLRGFVTLRIFGRNKSQSSRIQEMGDQYTAETMKVLRISFLSAFALELCATISVALIAVAIGLRLVDGEITFLAGLTVLLLAPEVYFPLRNAASLYHSSADGKAALDQIEKLLASASQPVTQINRNFSNFETLSWQEWVLDIPNVAKFNLSASEISRGEVLFITGHSGSGKSTFAKNLLGLTYDAEIYIDGAIRLSPEYAVAWQKIIGWIPQTPHLANGTLADQFRSLKSDITDLEISEALRRVGLDPIELPLGLLTKVGGSGEKSDAVSGGQLRKIAIARALLLKPDLIIADEPSADLDEVSARIVMKELRRVVKEGAALICITHDSAMIHDDDRFISFASSPLAESKAR